MYNTSRVNRQEKPTNISIRSFSNHASPVSHLDIEYSLCPLFFVLVIPRSVQDVEQIPLKGFPITSFIAVTVTVTVTVTVNHLCTGSTLSM